MVKVGLYGVCLSYITYCPLYYIITILTLILPPYLCHLTHQGQGVKEVFTTRIQVTRGQEMRLMVEVKFVYQWIQKGMK